MSSIRLFLLDAFERHGEMHGYELTLLAERERIEQWTDVSISAIYGALKRITTDGLVQAVRVERDGSRPARQVLAITDEGRSALAALRRQGLERVHVRPDPVDLALSRSDPDRLDTLPATLEDRLAHLRRLLTERERFCEQAEPHLSLAERHALRHRAHLLHAEIAWHEEVLAAADDIVRDERREHEPR